MSLKKGTKVSVPCGMECRTLGVIVAGPNKYTAAELAENIRINEEWGYSTKRMCKSYYTIKTGHGRMTCATSHVRSA